MLTEHLIRLLDALTQLSTEVIFALFLRHLERTFADVVFSLDLIVILLTMFAKKVAAKHQTVRPMGRRLGFGSYYTDRQLEEIERLFLAGLGEPPSDRPSERPDR